MENSGKLSLQECLEISVNVLGNISVPVSLNEEIAKPIAGVRKNLQACMQFLEELKAKRTDTGKMQILPDGTGLKQWGPDDDPDQVAEDDEEIFPNTEEEKTEG